MDVMHWRPTRSKFLNTPQYTSISSVYDQKSLQENEMFLHYISVAGTTESEANKLSPKKRR